MTPDRWAELRQVGFAALDHAAAVRTATELLALGPGFSDPLLAALHLADFTAPAEHRLASADVDTGPIGACCTGTRQPVSSVKRVTIATLHRAG